MAGLEQLKKRLRGVRLSGQLAGAMKTVASAKYAKVNKQFISYRHYLHKLERLCGLYDRHDLPVPEGKSLYIVLGFNRGLCGAYNAELHAFAASVIAAEPGALVAVCGKQAISYFAEKGIGADRTFVFSDIPSQEEQAPLYEYATGKTAAGEVDRVMLVRQSYVNTLTQKPVCTPLLPITGDRATEGELLLLPDPATVRSRLLDQLAKGRLYRAALEATLGAQAATLNAMRTAYDNAKESEAKLEHEINRKRQSAVTTGVIETSAGAFMEGDETDGERG